MSEFLQTELVMSLAALQNSIQKKLSRALSAHGISLTEFTVLLQLQRAPENRMRRIDLAEQVGLSASGVTRLINPMEKIGLVRKEEKARDARVSLVVLSAAGQRVFHEAEDTFGHAATALLSPIEEKKQETLLAIVKTLL